MSKVDITHEEFTRKHTNLIINMVNWHKKEIKVLEKYLETVCKKFENKGDKNAKD